MNSKYLHDIVSNHASFTIKDFPPNYKYYTIPHIGPLQSTKKYSLEKKIFDLSRVYYGNSKVTKINNFLSLQLENNIFNRKKWYISTIKSIIKNYEKVFNFTLNFPIFVQIIENKKYTSNKFIGAFSSYQGVELVLYKNINNDKDTTK